MSDINQGLEIYTFLKQNKKNQLWLAKKISTRKRKYSQPEISRALNGHDVILLNRIRQVLKLSA